MFKLAFDVGPFIQNLSDFEKRQLPFALMQALNDSMFAVQKGWKEAITQVFDRPTALTVNAVRYIKATKDNLVAVVYIRDEVSKGTAPSKYLISEVTGGQREPKPFERLLRSAGVMFSNEFAVPARGAPLDAYGNLQGGLTRAILSDVRAERSSDTAAFSTAESRRKRKVRNRKRAGQGVYFASRGKGLFFGKVQHLPKGIYERQSRGFTGPRRGGQSGVRMILAIVEGSNYRTRFNANELAQQLFLEAFPTAFRFQFARAVLNAKPRS